MFKRDTIARRVKEIISKRVAVAEKTYETDRKANEELCKKAKDTADREKEGANLECAEKLVKGVFNL